MSDGTTNTFLLVESKQDVPWTKPADIPFDPLKPPSSVRSFTEGQFFVCMADGSRRRIRNDDVKGQRSWLILRNDGHPIPWDEIMPVPRRENECRPNPPVLPERRTAGRVEAGRTSITQEIWPWRCGATTMSIIIFRRPS